MLRYSTKAVWKVLSRTIKEIFLYERFFIFNIISYTFNNFIFERFPVIHWSHIKVWFQMVCKLCIHGFNSFVIWCKIFHSHNIYHAWKQIIAVEIQIGWICWMFMQLALSFIECYHCKNTCANACIGSMKLILIH